jgi:hypothetical protein
MEAALFGLLGTVVGGAITILVAYFSNRKDLRLKELEWEQRREESRDAERAKDRERRLDRYASFLGAYRHVQGGVVDIVLLMRDRPTGWESNIGEIVDSPEFSTAVGRLNDGAAWVALLCREPRATALVTQLNAQHDALFEELRRTKTAITSGSALDMAAITAKRGAADATFEGLLQCLRGEMVAV